MLHLLVRGTLSLSLSLSLSRSLFLSLYFARFHAVSLALVPSGSIRPLSRLSFSLSLGLFLSSR